MTKFSAWFKRQFGLQPGGNKSHERLRIECEQARANYEEAVRVLQAREKYTSERTAAHYAWVAHETFMETKLNKIEEKGSDS